MSDHRFNNCPVLLPKWTGETAQKILFGLMILKGE
jgi:hypothetical protein